MQIQISWLLQKPTDLDLLCLQRQGILDSAGQGLKTGPKNVTSKQKGIDYIENDTTWVFALDFSNSVIKRLSCN